VHDPEKPVLGPIGDGCWFSDQIMPNHKGDSIMRLTSALRAGFIAAAMLAGLFASSAARADEGSISFKIIKAGFVIGGSAGSGVLHFQGRTYSLSVGGISYGFTFGASETRFRGTVSNIRRASDVAGVYAAGNVGAAVGRGAQAIVLTNQHGAVLTLTGNSVGAIVSADLNGLALTVR
jgi:lipid-binding SYLF domain-containing protein